MSSLSLEGHEDWVKCLALTSSIDEAATETLVLASGSQDGYIRLWLVAPLVVSEAGPQAGPVDELMDAFERSLGEMSDDAEEGGKKISNRAHVFAVHDPLHGSKSESSHPHSHDALRLIPPFFLDSSHSHSMPFS